MSRSKDNSKNEVELDNLVHEEVIVEEESPMPTHIKYSLFTFILYFLGLKKMEIFEVQEKCEDNKEEWPEFKVNIFSRLTYSWFSNLLFTGYYQPLQHHHIWQMSEGDSAYQIRFAFNKNWKKYSPSLLKTLHHAFGWKFYAAAIPKFIYDNLNFTGPMLLGFIIDYLDDENAPYWHGLLLVAILTLSYITQTLLINIYFQIASRTGMHLRNAVVTAVYEKSLRLSNKARQEMSTGAIVDFMSNDAQRLNNITTYFHILWSGPYQILLALIMLYTLLGALPTLAGLIYMLLLIPVNSVFLKKNKQVRMDMMKITDDRVKWTNEVLQSMRAIKQYAYEYQFIQKITDIRSKELSKLLTFQLIKALNMWISYTSPIAVSVVSLSTYVLLGNELTASVIFPALALFNLLRFPLSVFPSMVTSAAEVWVSIKRIQKFLLAEEMVEMKLVDDLPLSSNDSPSVLYLEGNFSWDHIEEDDRDNDLVVGDEFLNLAKDKKKKDKSDKISLLENNVKEEGKEDLMEAPDAVPEKKMANSTLKNIRLVIGKNAKVGVIGQVGAGKSTLLSAIIGELYSAKQSKIGIKGRISYVPQQAWIMNDTVRNNIIFGATYDEERYNQVIRACALEPDLDQLSAGDLTEIGEKGINLSGGQKQRISIARAVYQNTDIYLLDDPLSAVDAMVAKHIFDRVICGLLKEKTVILVTHYLHLLSSLDYVVSMKDGEIDEQGSFNELIKNKGNFARLINDYTSSLNDVKQEELLLKPEEEIETNNFFDKEVVPVNHSIPSLISTEIAPVKAKKEPELMEKEEREVGAVKFKMYYEYARSAGTSLFFIFIIFTYALAQFLKMGSDSWISFWTDDSQFENFPLSFYFGIYLAWCGTNAIVVIISNIATAFVVVSCSKNLHANLLNQIIRAPTRFYESTPLGRILNRFAKDMDNIDTSVPDSLTTYLRTIVVCIGTLILVVFITPISILALIPVMFFYYRVQLFYRASSREMKRIESISKSPIFAHFSETLNGLSSIRAYGVTEQFIKMNEGKTDYNNRAYFAMQTSNRWLSIRLEIIATTIVFACALVVVTGSINSSEAGLLLSYTLSITGWLSWLVRSTADAEQQMNSVERVIFYSQLETEPPFFRESDKKLQSNWPAKGVIQFNDVILKYREGLEQNALNKVSFQIKSHEKIGVCGRTGAGKSSILVALFRLIELHSGSILIDDVDISKIGLHTLRKKLAIIPQDPILFTGDIRSNLDPFDQYNDQQIWEALEMVQMKQTVEGLEGKLRNKVSEMGLGFSVGQRQLLSFARALLLKAEILLLDEATASCDLETDTLIQTTLREKFVNCTVITIAHRLNTIMDSDRILVMSDGEVVEFDEPYLLLTKQEGSHLLKMVEETGDAADHLISIAELKYLDLHPSADQFVL